MYSPHTRHPGSEQVWPLVDAGAHQHASVRPALDGQPDNNNAHLLIDLVPILNQSRKSPMQSDIKKVPWYRAVRERY